MTQEAQAAAEALARRILGVASDEESEEHTADAALWTDLERMAQAVLGEADATPDDGAFAKLFGRGSDQVLVKLERDSNGDPEVRAYWRSPSLGGVCNTALGFDDTDAGWGRAEAAFAAITEEQARSIAATAENSIGGSDAVVNRAFPAEREPGS